LAVHKLPQPRPMHISRREAAQIKRKRGSFARRAGDRILASYANFYIGNSVVVMPLLDPSLDAAVAKQLASLFPRRRVIGVSARDIVLGGGGIHCITQQIPLATTNAKTSSRAKKGK
jgi:agmatine deiminase